jgi:outer membrane protein assembly factor BamB
MRARVQISFLTYVLGGLVLSARAETAVNITQHHNNSSRDGLYIDPAFTQAAAANVQRDLAFDGTIAGHVYAQPLYLDKGPGGRPAVFVVTESDNVYALDAGTGAVIWQRQVGGPMPKSGLPCGNIDPLGITGTPVIDLPSRQLFFDAMTTPDGGTTAKHLIFALDVDTGKIKSGWPVDVNAKASFLGKAFNSKVQNQRGALAVVGGILYVPYGGLAGDCGDYRGWLVGVPLNNPANVVAWAPAAAGGGSWAPGGVASDGSHLFIATGNTFGASTWSGGEAILHFQSGPVFSGRPSDYWSPLNWQTLDAQDLDLGGSGPLLVDLPGATPSQLVIALGKDGNAYVLDRASLGGVSTPLAQAHVSTFPIIQAGAAYRTTQGTYIVLKGDQLISLRLGAAHPPSITRAWATSLNGRGSPFVTTTDGTHDVVVWAVGSEGDHRLHGFDGDTGAEVFSGGGADELMTGTRRSNTGIVAHGRIYFAADSKVYTFTAPPIEPIVLTRQITGSTNALWDFSTLTNEFQIIELKTEKIMDAGTNFIHAAFAAPYAQDGRGRLAGSGSASVVLSSNVTDPQTNALGATYVSKGSVTSSKGVARLVLSVKVSGQALLGDNQHPVAQRSVILNVNSSAKFDAKTNQMSARVSGTASTRGLLSLSNRRQLADVFPAELGDGSWTLGLQFGLISGNKASGTATVTLSTGQVYPFTCAGTFAPRTGQWKLNLKGVGAGKGSNLQVIAQGSDITKIVGRVSGQSVKIKL